MPFGPEVSWPNGFRPLDPESRDVLESGFGAPPDRGRGHDQAGPRSWADGGGAATYGTGFAYQQPAIDDYGYGDPGYSDPSYDGPRGPVFPGRTPGSGRNPGASAHRPPETIVPDFQEPSGPAFGYQRQDFAAPPSGHPGSQEIYPVTGAQEALPDTGPQPLVGSGPAYPDERYGHPRLNDRALGEGAGPRASDPRLEGMRYDELRYEEPDGPDYDEPLDDESWFKELRRSAPAYPQDLGDGQRHVVPPRGQQPAAERGFGYGQGRDAGTGPGTGGGLSSRNEDQPAPASGPWMSARGQAEPPRQPGPAFPQDLARPGAGFLGAPTSQVGVLTPPAGTRVDDLADDGPLLAGPSAAPFLAPGRPGAVRPGHGLDGPEITSSWPAQPSSVGPDAFDEFWQEDDGESDYSGLFGDEDEPDGAKAGAKRRTGRRRGRSNDHRLWLALGGMAVVTAAAITGIIKFEFPSHSGPSHAMVTPPKIGTYLRTVALERQTKVAQLRDEVIKMSSGQASRVVSAVYESGNSAAGGTVQIVMFVGGHLANAAPTASITGFTQQFPGAKVVGAGSLGGQAACVEEAAGSADSKSICVWFDDDSFGEIVSPTMNATALANEMRTLRPSVELVVKK